jgi:hypothetical protein
MEAKQKCPACEGQKEGMFSCCTGLLLHDSEECDLCPVCKEHMGIEKCDECNGTGEI